MEDGRQCSGGRDWIGNHQALQGILFSPPCLFSSSHLVLKQHEPISATEFMTKWKRAVGDAFESIASLRLLSVRSPFG